MGLLFYPRGGSAHVARNLAHGAAARRLGRDDPLRLASRSPAIPATRARFYRGPRRPPGRHDARAATRRDPLAADPPLHPSYEDRPGAPDRVFALLDDDDAEHQVAAWARALQSAGAADADVLHLHHLTPLYEAARARRARTSRSSATCTAPSC